MDGEEAQEHATYAALAGTYGNDDRLDRYVVHRVLRWQWRRDGQRTRFRFDRWPRERLYDLGLH
jgi:hypothetical protein